MKPLIELHSPNRDERGGSPIDILLLHYTGMPTASEARSRLMDPTARVSAHYFIDLDGAVTRLVEEGYRAWHAGVSCWAGETDINARSIGVEIVNPGHEFGYREFPERQIGAVIELCGDILRSHAIPADRVLGHSDVAPLRKTDPGELFPWARLAQAGIGLWPDDVEARAKTATAAEFAAELRAFGYGFLEEEGNIPAVITAYQRHFQPAALGTTEESKPTPQGLAILKALNAAKALHQSKPNSD